MRQPTTVWVPRVLAIVLCVVTLAAYVPSFRGAFVFDDIYHVIQNGKIRTWSRLAPELPRSNRPVVFLSLWANYRIGRLDVLGYHVVNFAVHLAAGLLLFGLVRRTLRLPPLDRRFVGSRADMAAFAVALLWLIHPLQVQAVTYIIQRCESMMGMFFLLGLYSLLRGSQSAHPWRWYAAGTAAVWLGMGCKEVMITFPVVALLFDRIFLAGSWRELWRRRWGLYLAMMPAIAWLMAVTAARRDDPSRIAELAHTTTPLQYMLSQPTIILHYLRLAVLPDKLCFDYSWPAIEDWRQALPAGLVLLSLFVGTAIAVWRRPYWGFAPMAFFIVLAPTSSVNPIMDLAVEHRMYLPLAAILLTIVLAFTAVVRRIVLLRRHRAAIYLALLLVIGLAWTGRTLVRNQMYTKPSSLWANALAQAPDNARAHNNLGCYLIDAGEVERAGTLFRRAVELDPVFGLPYCNLARYYQKKNLPDEAIGALRAGVAHLPRNAMVHCDLGMLLGNRGDLAEAARSLQRALEIDPGYGKAHYHMGKTLSRQGKCEEAIPHFLAALKKRPKDLGTSFRLAYAYQQLGKFSEAISYYERSLEISPEFEKARKNLELCRAGDRKGEPPSDEVPAKPEAAADAPQATQPKDRLAAGH